jgi:hypothetical protein
MARLRAVDVRYLFVHTAASTHPESGKPMRNVDAAEIHRWHIDNGWAGVGYHFVILDPFHDRFPDGTLQVGRPLEFAGAHVEGVNHCSIGICCVGDGDRRPFTEAQTATLATLVGRLMAEYDVPLARVLGHHEINDLVIGHEVSPAYRTAKTCPGALVPMDALRDRIAGLLVEAHTLPVPRLAPPTGAPHLPGSPA